MRIRKVDASAMDRKPGTRSAAAKKLTPAQQERQRQQKQLARVMGQLNDKGTVFEVRLGRDEKPITVRQRLLRAAQDQGKEVAVRRSENGFMVGLMTPERRSTRGRRRKTAAA